MKKKVSIIMPIYNSEKYMSDAIESILKQSYENIELILIDDGSNDESPIICDKYAKRDSRIKVVHKENCGCAAARNDALKLVTGEYISFVDSDDLISGTLYELLINNLEKYDADISICNYKEFKDEVPEDSKNERGIEIYSNDKAVEELNLNSKFTLALWSKLYKTELFEGETFPLIKSSSDNFIAYRLLNKSNRIVYDSSQKYYYRVAENSITHKKGYINMPILYEGRKIVNYISKYMPSQYESTIYKYMFLCLGLYNSMIQNDIIDKDNVDEIYEQIVEWNKLIKGKIKYSNKQKLQLRLFLFNKKIYRFLYKKLKM